MSLFFRLQRVSKNRKTGPIPVSRTSENTCPDNCGFKLKGCYAKYGPSGMQWRKVSNGETGYSFDQFANEIKALPKNTLWRHNEAGDLPSNNAIIDRDLLGKLIKANVKKRGFTYTHHRTDLPDNIEAIKEANNSGFTVNLSCDTKTEAIDKFYQFNLPTVCVLPKDAPNMETIQGVKIVACPAEKSDKIQCINCGLCAVSDRNYIIGFRAHGTASKTVDLIARG